VRRLAGARLELTGGVAGMTLRTDPALVELYAGRFQDKPPTVEVEGGTVRIALRHKRLRPDSIDLALNPVIPWDVDISGGVWKLHADLRGLRLRSLALSGGLSDATLLLPVPVGTVPLRVNGGVNKLTAHRPPGVAARVRVGVGASKLTLDTMHLGSVGGETRWETPDFETASDRYDVELDNAAHRMTFDTNQDAGDEAPVGSAPGEMAQGGAESLSAEEFPALASLADKRAKPDPDARFEFGLSVLLDGLERRLL
jgi:hypothetical protein